MKRFLYIVAVLLVSLLIVLGIVVGILMSPKVERLAVQLATAELSRALGTQASVGDVEYRFPARVAFRDVYIEDQQHDTLAFVGELYAHFRPLPLRDNEIRFSHVRVSDVVANIHRLPDSTWNYAFLVEAFRSDSPSESGPMKSLVSVKDIQLRNIRLRYEDYEAYVSRAAMDLHHLNDESLDAEIGDLQAVLKRRAAADSLEVESVKARVIFNDTLLSFPTLAARLPRSRLDMSGVEVHFPSGDTLYLSKSADSIDFDLQFKEAQVVLADLALFVPKFRTLTRPIALQGALGGTLDSLRFSDMEVRYNGRAILRGEVSAVGLPDLDNPYIRANLTDVHTNAAQLQDFLSQLNARPVQLAKIVHRLGDVHYRGLAEGHLHHLTLHGAFRTDIGTITTDGSFDSDSLFEHMTYDAGVVGRKLRVGYLFAHDKLGTATLEMTTTGHIDHGAFGDIDAHVRELTYNDYTYEDLHLNGHYEPRYYDGRFDIDDPHLNLAFNGLVDLHDVDPEINFNLRCRHFDSQPLGIESIGDKLRTSFVMNVDMNGSKVDEMSGYMILDSLFIATAKDSTLMRRLTLLASSEDDGYKSVTVTSDYGTAQLDGLFRYGDVIPSLQAMVHHYLPSAVDAPSREWQPVQMTVKADGERLRDIQRLFTAPITLSDHPSLRAKLNMVPEREPSMDMRFSAPGVRAGNTPVHDITLTLNTVDTLRHRGADGSGLSLSVSAEALKMQTVFSCLAFHDSMLTHLTLHQEEQLDERLPEGWRDLSPRELQRALSADLTFRERQQTLLAAQRAGDYGGDIRCVTHFAKYNGRPLIDMHFSPGKLILRDTLYTLSESSIVYCAADTMITVDHFEFEGNGQHLRAHGAASRRATDTLAVDLRKIDASYVVPFILPVQTIMFNGLLTGRADVTSVFRHPQVETQIHIDSMGLNNCYFGDAEVNLHITDSLAFHADVYRPDREVVDLEGKALFDGSGRWELDMTTDSVPLAFINHWTANVLRDLDGNATGRVVVGGRKGLVYVLLKAAAQNASLTLPWTGVRYTIPEDTIVMDTTAIRFPNVHLVDAEGNKVEVNGAVMHDQFRDFALDMHVDVHDALVFGNDKAGERMQGTVYASGHVDVTGPSEDLLVFADAVTSNHSRFRLSLDNASSAYESNFIHFVQHPDSLSPDSLARETDLDNIDIKTTAKKQQDEEEMYKRAGRCVLKLNMEVNPYLLFQLVLGERNGDMIQARGAGALRLTYDTQTGDVRLLGTYDLDQGTMHYTVANVIRKEFTVGEGSTIVFSGDPSNPQLDVTAKYRVTANLRDLFGDEADQLATSRSNIPVLTCLHLTGPLSNPVLSFALEFPQSDQAIQQQVRQVINTDEMLMRQVIYLLVFGRFFTPDYMSNSQFATLNSTYSLLSSTVTSQINAWLSKLTNVLTLGVAIRTDGEGADASQEYEAQFQLQPVDRLVINGNVGYRYNDISNQPFFGDLDVEVLLTEDGQWRLKGYTHTVDKYSLRQASTIQGFGFMWKKDFNWPSKKDKTAPADTTSTPVDTTALQPIDESKIK